MKILINLKAIEITTTDVEDLMIVKRQLMVIDEEYKCLIVDTPDWVTDKLDEVTKEITGRMQAELKRKLKAATVRRAALKTADEKRKDLDTEIEALTNKLAGN